MIEFPGLLKEGTFTELEVELSVLRTLTIKNGFEGNWWTEGKGKINGFIFRSEGSFHEWIVLNTTRGLKYNLSSLFSKVILWMFYL